MRAATILLGRHARALMEFPPNAGCPRIIVRRAFTACLLVLVVLPALVAAAELPVTLIRVTSPVAPRADATLEVKTSPKAECRIAVIYKSGRSQARGLGPLAADGAGRVTWTWRVGSNTTAGRWPIHVTCRRGESTGALRTSFEVR